MQSFTSQIFEVVGPLGENLDFFSPLGFDVQTNSDHKAQKIKLYSVKASKYCLNEKSLIHDRVMATISKFSPQIFETFFKRFAETRDTQSSFSADDTHTVPYSSVWIGNPKCNVFRILENI